MSSRWDGQSLLQPITTDQPCGENLEDTALLASIEASRLFGRSRPFDAPPDQDDRWKPPDWNEFTSATLDALGKSKDLRLLANLGSGLLRTDGIRSFLQTLTIASSWLESYWTETFPRLDDGDPTVRRNALNCFSDSMAVVDGIRRLPLVSSRQHGTFSLRDIDIATGQIPPRDGEVRPDEAQINAAFGAMPAEELASLHGHVTGALAALRQIEVTMGTNGGPEAVPAFEPLSVPLTRIDRILRSQVATRAGASEVEAGLGATTDGPGAVAVGAIRSRQDAVRALDAVAEYFRRNEPSSPIPMFIDRAKRLVSKSFLEVLADVAPDALPQARVVGGVAEEQS